MSKIIIIKKEDGGVVKITPNQSKYGDEDGKIPYSECKALQPYIDEGLEWFICDHEDLPSKSDCESRKQLYHDGNSVKIDTDWSIRLMPDQLIKKKHLARLCKKIDAELEKETPCPISLAKLQRSHSICKDKKAGVNNDDHFWSKIALENLDDHEASGGEEKKTICEKLKAKIKELQGE